MEIFAFISWCGPQSITQCSTTGTYYVGYIFPPISKSNVNENCVISSDYTLIEIGFIFICSRLILLSPSSFFTRTTPPSPGWYSMRWSRRTCRYFKVIFSPTLIVHFKRNVFYTCFQAFLTRAAKVYGAEGPVPDHRSRVVTAVQ